VEEKENNAENTAASGNKIDLETAEKEFNLFCDNNEIERDETAMNDDEKETFGTIKKGLIKACMAGRVEVDGTSIKYTISKFAPEGFRGEVLFLKRPGGQAFSAMDGYKDDKNIARMVAFMSAMTGKDTKYFSKIDGSDWKFIRNIVNLFLS
jgi:hypothetical protein